MSDSPPCGLSQDLPCGDGPAPSPQDPLALDQLARQLLARGDLAGTLQIYEQLLTLLPDAADIHHNLAVVLRRLGDLPAAAARCRKALELRPDDPDARCNLALIEAERGDRAAAIAGYRQVLALRPDHRGALNNLGGLLQELGDLQGATDCCLQLLRHHPHAAEAHYHLGLLHWEQGDLDRAADCYRTALSLQEDCSDAHNNLGVVLYEKGRLPDAVASYRRALAIQPETPDVVFNLALALLALDQADEGWIAYEARLEGRDRETILVARPQLPRWPGPGLTVPTADSPLLLVAEQGLGDTLQLLRYLPGLRRQGWEVRLCAPSSLHGLIRSSGIDRQPLDRHQAEALERGQMLPLFSLPRHLGVRPGQPLCQAPYLRVGSDRIARWWQRLEGCPRPILGINWQGNPTREVGPFRGRSLPLEAFSPLARRTEGSLLALQKGAGSEQLQNCSFRDRFVGCQEQISAAWDFEETAAIIACCDLVITSDTCVAHLAGGMGHPTWLLLQAAPDWRWGMEGESSPWYPAMRLFRQRRRGDWCELMERVALALAAWESPAAASSDAGSG